MAIPLVRTTAQALYPFRRAVTYATRVQTFQNASEQRQKIRACLQQFELPYGRLQYADKELIRTAVASARGQLDITLSLVLGATTYTDLTLTSDEWSAVENREGQYDTKLTLRQLKPQATSPAVPSGTPTFPALAAGPRTQLPFTQAQRYQTLVDDMDSGMRYAYGEFGTGLTGFPTRGLMKWTVGGPMLQDADVATLEAWFHYARGRYLGFQFVDPDSGTTYTKVRHAEDSLVIDYRDFNQTSVIVNLVEFN